MAKYRARPLEVEAWPITAVRPVDPHEIAYDITFDMESTVADRADWWVSINHPEITAKELAIPREMTARMIPQVGDYYVKEEVGYCYFNPKAVFERKYEAL